MSICRQLVASTSRARFPAQVTRAPVSRSASSWGGFIRSKLLPGEKAETSDSNASTAVTTTAAPGGDLFDSATALLETQTPKKTHTEHKYSTASFKMSHRKLNDLGRQIAGKPIDAAILQMVFSEKRASTRIKSMLCVARDHAEMYKGLDRSKLVVAESWVSKGEKIARFDIKGRGRAGIKHHPKARLTVILREGKTRAEKLAEERAYKLKKIRSPGLVREDKPIRNPGPMWAW